MNLDAFGEMMCTYLIYICVVWFVSVSMVLHSLDHIFVETEAEKFAICDKWFQDEPQAFLDLFQLDGIADRCEIWIVGEYWDCEHKHVVWQNVRKLRHCLLH